MFRSKILVLPALFLLMLMPVGLVHAQDGVAAGTAVIWDDMALSDAITYSMTDVPAPAAGREYVGWLVSDDGLIKLNTGPMTVVADGSVAHTFDSSNSRYTGENLILGYDKVVITDEAAGDDPDAPAGPAVFHHVVPAGAMAHIKHLLATWPPDADKGILTNLREQLDVAILHANLAQSSDTIDNIRLHTHHVINIIEGADGANYDVSFGDPGDGLGVLLHAEDRKHGPFAAGAAAGDEVVVAGAALVDASGRNAADWATVARDTALDVLATDSVFIAKVFLGPGGNTVISSLEAARNGSDANNDGTIASTAGEGGAEQAYWEAQRMATYTLEPGGPPAAGGGPGSGQPGVGLPTVGDPSVSTAARAALIGAFLFLGLGGFVLIRGRRSRTDP